MSDLVLITPPTVMPVTLADAKLQCGYGPDDDADHMRSLQIAAKLRGKIASATRMVENQLSRGLMPQTWQLTLDRFPRLGSAYTHSGRPEIWLPKPPLIEVTSFQYTDTSGATQIVSPAIYEVLNGGEEASRIVLLYSQIWPVTLNQAGAVVIQFQCGYASPAALPATIKDAILMTVEYLNGLNGENAPMPQAIKNMLSYEYNALS